MFQQAVQVIPKYCCTSDATCVVLPFQLAAAGGLVPLAAACRDFHVFYRLMKCSVARRCAVISGLHVSVSRACCRPCTIPSGSTTGRPVVMGRVGTK